MPPKTWTPLALAPTLCLVLSGNAEAIEKWRTPDGELYFGNNPPSGSVLERSYEDTPSSAAPPVPDAGAAGDAPGGAGEGAAAPVDAGERQVQRWQMESAAREAANRLRSVQDRIRELRTETRKRVETAKGQNITVSGNRPAGFRVGDTGGEVRSLAESATAEIERLEEEERRLAATIRDQREAFGQLSEDEGSSPPDFRCGVCPSPAEIERILEEPSAGS